MLKILYERLNVQGYRTMAYPAAAPPAPPERFRGLPYVATVDEARVGV